MRRDAQLVLGFCFFSGLACGGGSVPGPVGGPNAQQPQLGSPDAGRPSSDANPWTTLGNNDSGAIAPNAAMYGRIAVAAGVPYAIFSDLTASGRLTVMKLVGNTWTKVGAAGFTSESSDTNYNFVVEGTTPYVAYVGDSSSGISVMKFNGSAWTLVGPDHFARSGGYSPPSLAVDNGTAYVAFSDDANRALHVMSFNGTAWVDVGGTALSTSYVDYFVMTIFNGAVYVAYSDYSASPPVTKLVTWNGAIWSLLATSPYTMEDNWGPLLTGSANSLYLIFYSQVFNSATSNSCGPVVLKLTENTLTSVGTPCSISAGDDVEYVSGTVFGGVPYVAFDDESRDNDPEPRAAVVKYFDGTAWQLYAGYPSPDDIENTFLVADPATGRLYLTYSDWSGGMIVQVH